MKRNPLVISMAAVILIIGAAVAWWLISPYFINDEVDEAFPDFSAEERDAIREMPEDQQTILIEMSSDNQEMAQDTARAMMSDDTVIDDVMPEDEESNEPMVVLEGTFSFIDSVHNGEGSATIYELPESRRVLRFENFQVTNGPQLHVILSPEEPTSILDGVGDYVDLGALKGNIGNQNYEIPDDVDLSLYKSIVIYCVPFRVVFSAATLEPMGHN